MSKYSLKKGNPIPDGHYVVRYCQEGTWERNEDGTITVFNEAFESALFPNFGVSVNWLGRWKNLNDVESLRKVRCTSGHQGMREEGLFAKLKADDIRNLRQEMSQEALEVIFWPFGDNESHSRINPPGDETITALRVHAEDQASFLEVPSLP